MNNHRIKLIEKRLDAIEEKIGSGTINVDDEGMFVYSSSFEESKEPCKIPSLWQELTGMIINNSDDEPGCLATKIIELLENRCLRLV